MSRICLRDGQPPASIRMFFVHIILLASVLQFIIPGATAHVVEDNESEHDSPLFKRLARAGMIHVDSRSQPPTFDVVQLERRVPRAVDSSTISSSVSPSPTASTSSSSATSSIAVVATTLPTPFDTSLGSNFTQSSCPAFFRAFLSNSTFTSCHPVSLLLQNSLGFFQATRSGSLLNATLDAACSASLAICSPLMSSLASDMITDDNCGADYKRENPVVMQAYAGLLAYEPVYNATCLQDPPSGNYCYSEAIVNSTNPSDSYPYYTALGIPLPSGAQPTCSTCLQRTMSTFAGYAKLKGQPLARTYLACASQVDSTCGSSFANTQVQVGVVSSNDAVSVMRSSWSLTFAATVVLLWPMLA